MMTLQIPTETTASRPVCNSEAIYKYGKTRTGKQIFQCLMCGRQFSHGAEKQEIQSKPICPECGNIMHLYKIEGSVIIFRCAGYPECKTFRKFRIKED